MPFADDVLGIGIFAASVVGRRGPCMSNDSSSLHIPLMEKLKSIPEVFGIRLNEEPRYEVLKKEGAIEIRRYSAQLLAMVTVKGENFDDFRQTAFETLAKYIFGANAPHADMAMTSPVLQEQSGKQSWTMSFVLPSAFDMSNVPKPLDSRVKLQELPSYESVSIRYTGNNDLERVKENEGKLEAWLAQNPKYRKVGSFFSAQYDQPFAVPFLKRNEIHVKVSTNAQ